MVSTDFLVRAFLVVVYCGVLVMSIHSLNRRDGFTQAVCSWCAIAIVVLYASLDSSIERHEAVRSVLISIVALIPVSLIGHAAIRGLNGKAERFKIRQLLASGKIPNQKWLPRKQR